MTAPPDIQTSDIPALKKQPRDAFSRLTPFGWTGGLLLILGILAASFFLAGYFIIYYRNADMDFMIVYNALVMNDGKPQAFFDHPSYFTILSVKLWFQAMHALGLLDAWKLSSIPSALNLPAFEAAMTSAVRAGRIVAWLTATGIIVVFAALARCLFRDWRVALLATFAFAFSGGMAVEMRILRSELIAACLFAFALMILIIVGRRAMNWRPLALAGAAALCVLGMENKVQIILSIAALLVLILPFGTPASASTEFWRTSRAWVAALTAFATAALLFKFALPIILAAVHPAATQEATLHPLIGGMFGVYQIALLGWIVAGMIAYAVIWRISAAETLTSMFAVIAGASLGLLALYLHYDVQNAVAVVNPIEKMLVFADEPVTSAVDGNRLYAILSVLLQSIRWVLERYSFFLSTSPRPTVFLLWLIVPGILYALYRGERQVAMQATLLLLVGFGLDILGVRRGLKPEYYLLSDPLFIFAGALLLDQMSDLRWSRWTYPIGALLIVVHVAISQAEPIKHVMKRVGPEYVCDWNEIYQPEMPMPWCYKPEKKP